MDIEELASRLEKAEARLEKAAKFMGSFTAKTESSLKTLLSRTDILALQIDALKGKRAAKRKAVIKSDEVKEFITQRCSPCPEASHARDDIYAAYRQWCKETRRSRPLDLLVFSRNFRAAFPALKVHRLTRGRSRQTVVFAGIDMLREEEYSHSA